MQNVMPVLRIFFLSFCMVSAVATASVCAIVQVEQPIKQGITERVVQVVIKSALAPPQESHSILLMGEEAMHKVQDSQISSSELMTKDMAWQPIYANEIRAYLHGFDKWATFTSAAEFKMSLPAKNAGSVGMALVKNKKGQIVCVPYPNGPAAKAGILEGDVLTGVDSIESARKVFGGPIGSALTLNVERNNTFPTFTLKREKFLPPHVDLIQHEGFARIRIWYFDKNTTKLFITKVQQAGNQPLVVDVRGNSGGSILAARNCAAEFLPKGTLLGISKIRENKTDSLPKKKYISTNKDGKFLQTYPLILWQDDLTASAAEAFIVALVDNERATSMGTTTFGKAHAQSTFNVQGNMLRLSTEALLRLSERSWEGRGVEAGEFVEPKLPTLQNATQRTLF